MRNMTLCVLLVALAGLARAGDPAADKAKVLELLDKSKAAVQADRAQEAIACLQQAIQILQANAQQGLVAFLPAPPKDWTADEPSVQSGSWGSGEQVMQWTLVQRSYRQEEGDATYDVQLTNSPEMVAGQRQMYEALKSPQVLQMMQAGGDVKITMIDEPGWAGMMTVPKDGETTLMAITGDVLLQITSDDPALVKAAWDAIDRKGLAAAAATAAKKND